MAEQNHKAKFIEFLQSLKEDKAALSALRRGIAFQPGEFPPQFKYVVPWLYTKENEFQFFLTASLYGIHPESTSEGNFGDSFRKLKTLKETESIDLRFNAILQSHLEDIPYLLRNGVSLLASEGIAVNYLGLLSDLIRWDEPRKEIQKKWARGYWRVIKKNDNPNTQDNNNPKLGE